jgi:O-antigen ligase
MLQAASNRSRAEVILLCMLGIAALHAVGALVMLRNGDTLLGYTKLAYRGSATGTFVNRNTFATFMAFGLVLAGALLLDALYKTQRREPDAALAGGWGRVAILATAFCAIVAALVASQSRMGVLAAGFGLLTVLFCSLVAHRQMNRTILLGAAGALLVAILIALLNSGGLVERLLFTEESWDIRTALYQQVLGLIAQRPWTGFGGGAFEVIFPSVHQLPISIDRVWDKAHSTYLTLWVELGLIAGTALLALLAFIAWRLLRALRNNPARWLPLSVALGAFTVAATHSLIDFSLEIEAVTFWFVALLAIGVAQAIGKPKSE